MGKEAERQGFPGRVRLSRRAQGLTLEDVARRVGVTKGALSRYESGDVRVLGDATLRAVCGALGLMMPEGLAEAGMAGASPGTTPPEAGRVPHYCPTPFCRLNRPFLLPGQVRFMPGLVMSESGAEVACRYCGAALCAECPHCGTAVARGSGVCPACGTDYVPAAPLNADSMAILQFNAAAQAQEAGPTAELPFWAPLVRPTAPGSPGPVAAVGGVKPGGPSHGGAS